jgi:hypothetical protein
MSDQDRQRGESFLKEYFGARISRGSVRLPASSWRSTGWDEVGYNRVSYTVEQSHDIHLTQGGYEMLMDYLGYNAISDATTGYRTLDTYQREFANNLAVERKIRNDNPAVEKAYEKYRMLVDLVANGKKIED